MKTWSDHFRKYIEVDPSAKLPPKQDEVLYVIMPIFTERDSYEKEILEAAMGFKSMNLSGKDSEIFKLVSSYWCINLTKKCYVSSSSCYDHVAIDSEEFKYSKRGIIAGNKFKF
jgi:hypothetical protein